MPSETRRGASKATGGARNAQGGPAQASEGETPGPSQASQGTSSTAVRISADEFPESTKDKAFIVSRSNYNSAKMTANTSMEQVRDMAVTMQEKVQGEAAVSVLRRTAKRLQVSMNKAEDAIEEQIFLGTTLISFSSYLAVSLAETDPAQATQANAIQVAVGAEIKPLQKEVERVYEEYAHLFDMAEEAVSSQASSVCSSRAVSPHLKRSHFNEFFHLKPDHLSVECSVKEYNKWKTGIKEWSEHAFPSADQKMVWVNFKSCIDMTWLEVLQRTPGVEALPMTEVFALMEAHLLQVHPLITRRLATLRIQKPKEESISEHLHRLVVEYGDSQLDDAPVQTRILLHLIRQLGTSPTEEKVKAFLIESMRVQPDITDLAATFTYINNVEGDEAARKATQSKARVQVVVEKEQGDPPKSASCRLCSKKHPRGKCSYTCPHCHMKGSHKKDFCWTKYPELRKGGEKGKRGRSADRGRRTRSHSREATPHVNSRRVANRDSDTGRDSSVERSPARDKKKKKEKRRSKSRRVRSTSRGLQQLPSNVDVAPSGHSNNKSSIFIQFEPAIEEISVAETTSGSRRVRRTRAQKKSWDKAQRLGPGGQGVRYLAHTLHDMFDEQEDSEILDRYLARTLEDMFEEQEGDQWDVLCSLMKANNFHKLAEKGESAFEAKVRRIKVNRISEQAADPAMVGKILGFSGNRNIKFIADTGSPVAIIPRNLALQNRVNWQPVDPDEPSYEGVSGEGLTVLGQCSFFVNFQILREAKEVKALVIEEQGNEVLIDLDSLINWSIVAPNFPFPQQDSEKSNKVRQVKPADLDLPGKTTKLVDIHEKNGSLRTSLAFRSIGVEEYEKLEDFSKLRKALLREFSDVFTDTLGKDDRINAPPVKVDLIKGHEEIKPFNCMVPSETPRYLESAAKTEFAKLMKAEHLEEVFHPTEWCSRAFWVQKPGSSDDDPKVRLVTDLRRINEILQRVGYPMDGASHILKRLEPDETFFGVLDLSSGYHQVAIHEDSRDYFTIILPNGKFRYTVMPQGCSVSSDFFNLLTDPEIRGSPGMFKNVDDILASATSLKQLEERMRKLLEICRKRNMKLSPKKLQLGKTVVYGGCVLEGTKAQGDQVEGVYISPTKDKLEAFLNISTPTCKKEVQRLGGMAAQMKRWCPGLMLTFPGIQKLCAHNTPFLWNSDLEKELGKMKAAILEHVKLSPLDVTKDVHLWTDAAPTVGMSYLLLQEKVVGDESQGYNIITCDSTTFKRGRSSYSPFEAELAAVHWACKKEDYFLRGAKKIVVRSDAKNMHSFIHQPLDKIKNPREQRMVEELMPYRLEVKYIPGSETEVADYGSRNPVQRGCHEMFSTQPGQLGIAVRSSRVQSIDCVDPRVERLARAGAEDEAYIKMVEDIRMGTDTKHLSSGSELRDLKGCFTDLSIHMTEEGNALILRRGCEILVPRDCRAELTQQLHQTHLSGSEMKRLARGKFFWPRMAQQLSEIYDSCGPCKEFSNSKPTKPVSVIPENLQFLAPGEQISVDFCTFARKNIMVIKDRTSGLFWAKLTKDQTTDSAVKGIIEWSHKFGLPHEVRSDGGGTFRNRFSQEMEQLGVTHKLTSPYNSSSNGGAERCVRALKHVLHRDGVKSVSQEVLDKICFLSNSHAQEGCGSAMERFHGRAPRTYLPNSIERFVEHRLLIQSRAAKQEKLARKKGRTSSDEFQAGDHILIQDNLTKRWVKKGVIMEARMAEDNSAQSFKIVTEDGRECLRNKRFLKHQPKTLRFADSVLTGGTA